MIPRHLSPRIARVSIIALAILALGTVGAVLAYFSSSGSSTARAAVGAVTAPSGIAAQQVAAGIKVSWSAASLSTGDGVEGYRVSRSDGPSICGGSTPVTTLSCTDTGPAAGSTYTYTVTAVYRSFSASAAGGSVTYLLAPSIDSRPSNPSADSSPSFSFSGGAGDGYECKLDNGAFTSCSSAKSYGGLVDGSHTFTVHATKNGSTGPDTSVTWALDSGAPSITAKPSAPSANASPSFSFAHVEASYTFRCRLDGGGFASCASPQPYSDLTSGPHTFQVEGLSADGASTAVASYTWTIDASAPSITAKPASLSTTASASFQFTHPQAYEFKCQLDSGGFTSCTSPTAYTMADGLHAFDVEAVSTDGAVTQVASYSWTVDTAPPTTTIALSPRSPDGSGGWYKSAPTFTLSASDGGSQVATTSYSIDGGPTHAYPGSPVTIPEGQHMVTYWSTDAAGNAETPRTTTVKVDLTAPATSISLSGSPNASGWYTSAPTFTLSASDGGSGVAGRFYTIDGGTTQSYAAAVTIPEGQHTITYWSTDAAGNTETSHATTVKVDATAPTNSLSLQVSSGSAYLNGSTIYYRGSSSGSFKIVNAVGDSVSGPVSSAFPALGDAPGPKWSHTASTETTPTGGPYVSRSFDWSSGATTSPSETITAADDAGNTTSTGPITFTNDSAAPSGGSIGYTDGWYRTASVQVTFMQGSDSGSGMRATSGVLQRAVAQLSATGSCGSFGSFQTIATNPSSPYADSSVKDGNCYEYRYQISDNVDNVAAYTSASVAKIDVTAPTVAWTSPVNGRSYTISGNGSGSWNHDDSCSGKALCGTAVDGTHASGVAAVQIMVLGPNGKYWDGTFTGQAADFAASSPTWVPVSGTTSWTQVWGTGGFGGQPGSYTVSARATDTAGNTGSTVGATFTMNP